VKYATDGGMEWYRSKMYVNGKDATAGYLTCPTSHISLSLSILDANPSNPFYPSPNQRVIVPGVNKHTIDNTDIIMGVFNVRQDKAIAVLSLKPLYQEMVRVRLLSVRKLKHEKAARRKLFRRHCKKLCTPKGLFYQAVYSYEQRDQEMQRGNDLKLQEYWLYGVRESWTCGRTGVGLSPVNNTLFFPTMDRNRDTEGHLIENLTLTCRILQPGQKRNMTKLLILFCFLHQQVVNITAVKEQLLQEMRTLPEEPWEALLRKQHPTRIAELLPFRAAIEEAFQ
jgi:hypothetical protein